MIKTYDGRFVPKGDTEENWNKAVGFIPLDKEIIIYKADTEHPAARFKVGDGKTVVQNLPFSETDIEAIEKLIDEKGELLIRYVDNATQGLATEAWVNEGFETVSAEVQQYVDNAVAAVPLQIQADYEQNDPAAADYIKNRPFYDIKIFGPEKKYNLQLGSIALPINHYHLLTTEPYSEGWPEGTTITYSQGSWIFPEDKPMGTFETVEYTEPIENHLDLIKWLEWTDVAGNGQQIEKKGWYGFYENNMSTNPQVVAITVPTTIQKDFKQLDEKFIPDSIARKNEVKQQQQVDYDQNDPTKLNYIKNRPFYSYNQEIGYYNFYIEINKEDGYASIMIFNDLDEFEKFLQEAANTDLHIRIFGKNEQVKNVMVSEINGPWTPEGAPVSYCDLYFDKTELINFEVDNDEEGQGYHFIYYNKEKVIYLNEKFISNKIARVDNIVVKGGSGDKAIKMQDREGEKGNTFTFVRDGVCSNPAVEKLVNAKKISQFWDANGKVIHDAFGIHASAFGGITRAQGDRSHSEGSATIALGVAAHVEGSNSVACMANSHAEGSVTVAFKEGAHSEGAGTIAYEATAHSEGVNTIAGGIGAHAEGFGSHSLNDLLKSDGTPAGVVGALADYSHTEGLEALVKADAVAGHAEGANTTVEGKNGHAEGEWTIAKGQSAHAEGIGSDANGKGSHAEGWETTAEGDGAHSEGIGFEKVEDDITYYKASGRASHVEGYCTTASNAAAHAEGNKTTASGTYSHAEGFETIAQGTRSHAEGRSAQAYGDTSHAEGYSTSVYGKYSHAEGNGTRAGLKDAELPVGEDGKPDTSKQIQSAHAEGYNTRAKGNYSHAGGNNTIAGFESQTVIGHFNQNKSTTLFEIGNGSSSKRGNAFEVYEDGRAKVYGTPIEDEDCANKKYVDDAIANIERPTETGLKTYRHTIHIDMNSASSFKDGVHLTFENHIKERYESFQDITRDVFGVSDDENHCPLNCHLYPRDLGDPYYNIVSWEVTDSGDTLCFCIITRENGIEWFELHVSDIEKIS